jgi:hypothetical protein
MTDYPYRIRLRQDLEVHASRVVSQSLAWGSIRTAAIEYDQTACDITITTPEADDGCVYLQRRQPVTCLNCQTATSI